MTDGCIFSPVPVYKISIDQVQRLSYVDQLTMLCIFISFNMKNNFHIDSIDLLHFEKKNDHGFIAIKEKNILGKKLNFIINL